jgi:chlorinating enzyme
MNLLAGNLSRQQRLLYEKEGYYSPKRVLDNHETTQFLVYFNHYLAENAERLRTLLPRDRSVVFLETHSFLNWVYRIVSHPRILDAVEDILGSNILVWSSHWFPKLPGEKTYVSWHQDAVYWGLHPPKVTTAWVALSESTPANGCMR